MILWEQNIGSVQEIISLVCAFLCAVGLIIAPIYFYIVHRKYIREYSDQTVRQRYGPLLFDYRKE